MAVGDDCQSIYSFRGANYRNMFDFPRMFPETRIIKLEENYRSTQPILSFTNGLMEQGPPEVHEMPLHKASRGRDPQAHRCQDRAGAGHVHLRTSVKEQLASGRSLRDMAVLFRAAYHSFELELELAGRGIPFVKYGGFKFMESAHIKDLLAHLRVALNKEDGISWGRILRMLKNIGPAKSQGIIAWLKESGRSPWEIDQWPGMGKGDEALRQLAALMRKLSGGSEPLQGGGARHRVL